MKELKPFRVVIGSKFDAKARQMLPTAFHMTFWAADRKILNYLMICSWCPNGYICPAQEVEIKEQPSLLGLDYTVFSPN